LAGVSEIMSKVCSIFFFEGYVGVAPTIVNTSKILDSSGYYVTIYGNKNDYSTSPGYLGDKVKIIYFRKAARIMASLKKRFPDWVPLLELMIYTLQCAIHLASHPNVGREKINIGVDIYGAVAALICGGIFRQKFLFLSLELHEPEYRHSGASKIIASLGKLAYKKSEGLVIQDEDRFKTFCEYYGYQHPRVFYLPNSTLATQPDPEAVQGNYFREKFNLSQEEYPYIILQAGMICDAVYSSALAQAFASIDKCALIFHDRQARREEDSDIKLLRQINSKNLFLSLDPLPYDQVDRIFTALTIGLAFYADFGNNYAQIAMASGKLPQYLKYGKPVLVSNLPGLSKLVERYQCGLAIKDPSDGQEIQAAIDLILSDYETYSSNAKACFEAEFDFSKKMEPVLEFMNSL
jgi:glycosyltransferase involved in cell wall biosynthesis